MVNELQKAEKQMIGVVDKKMIQNFLFTSETKLTEKQQEMFLQIAVRYNLDPFKREIYAIAFGKEFSIVTGYEVYIQRAEKTGNLTGWKCENTEEGAEIMIHRKDWEIPFVWQSSYADFDKKQSSWTTMREFMIKKVCIGQGFRLAFPDELGGMPYLKEEMEGAKPFREKKGEVRKTTSKSKGKGVEVKTSVGKITSKQGKFPHKILGEGDEIYSTYSDSFADIAQEAMDSGMMVKIVHQGDQYSTIETIELVEPSE